MTHSAVPLQAADTQASVNLEAYRRTEATLRARELELSQLVDMVPSHLWRLTPDGEPTFFNKRMVDFIGLDVADTDRPGKTRLAVMLEASIHPDDAAAFGDTLRRCLATGELFAMRYRLRRADGAYRWMSSRAEPLRDQDGAIVQWYGLCHDIDDQMQADEALRRNERRLQQLIDAVPVRIWSTTPSGGPVYFNKRYKDHLRSVIPGFDSIAEPRMEPLLQELLHPDDAPAVWGTLQSSFATGEGCVLRFRWRQKDEIYSWAECRVEPWRDASGTIVQWYGVSLDIDEEVRAQEALRQSQQQLQQIIDAVPAIIWCVTADGIPCYFNKQATRITGISLKDMVAADGSRALPVVHPEDREATNQALAHSIATGVPFLRRYRQRRANGPHRWVESRAEPLRDESGKIVQWYGVSVDIDDEVRAQEALRQREHELTQLLNMVPVNIRRLNAAGEATFLNKRMTDFIGMDLDQLRAAGGGQASLALQVETFIHPDDAARLLDLQRRFIAAGEGWVTRYRVRRADGTYRWVEGRAEPLREEDGTISQYFVAAVEIDDEVRAQEALRKSERELSQILDMVPVHIRRLTPEGDATYFNKRMTDFLGLDLVQLRQLGEDRAKAGRSQFVHPDDAARFLEMVNRSLAAGEGWIARYRLRRADGVYRWVESRAEPMRDEDGRIAQYFTVAVDIDDYMRVQQAEESLRQASAKLALANQAASLSELSASIAHEVNQPLAAIVANSHACRRWLSAETPNMDRAKTTVERIIRDANAAADIVSRIRALFRHAPHAKASEDVNRLTLEVCRLMVDEITARKVVVKTSLDPDLPPVVLDRIQVQQVLVNLIRNGMEAMEAVTGGPRVIEVRSARAGSGVVRVEVRDAGKGFDDPERAFEPFFTTKENGMGMGLAICRSIVEAHGGRLWISNGGDGGAVVSFTLLLAPGEAQ